MDITTHRARITGPVSYRGPQALKFDTTASRIKRNAASSITDFELPP